MNDEYKEKLLKQFEQLNISSEEVERIIDLLHDSITLDARTGLKEQVEWLNRIIP